MVAVVAETVSASLGMYLVASAATSWFLNRAMTCSGPGAKHVETPPPSSSSSSATDGADWHAPIFQKSTGAAFFSFFFFFGRSRTATFLSLFVGLLLFSSFTPVRTRDRAEEESSREQHKKETRPEKQKQQKRG